MLQAASQMGHTLVFLNGEELFARSRRKDRRRSNNERHACSQERLQRARAKDSQGEGAAVSSRAGTDESDSGQTTEDLTTGHWLELTVGCDAEAVEAVAEVFAYYGFNQGVVIEEAFTQDADGDSFAVAPSTPVTVRTFLSNRRCDARAIGRESDTTFGSSDSHCGSWAERAPSARWTIVERREEEWANAWKAGYSVHRVGNRVLVKAPWHDYAPQPDETVIELDPGTAFGTGRHPSTQLCVQALEAELAAGDRVLDVGIGSGVLAIAAALLGASTVDGLDIDPAAIRAARANAARNGVGGIVRVALGSVGPDGPFPGPFDLVVANIKARVYVELAPALARLLAPGGTLILGGIIDDTEASVHAAFAAEPLTLVRRTQSEDWVALVWRKPD